MVYLQDLLESTKEWLPKSITARTVLVSSSAFLAALWLLWKRRGHKTPPGPTPIPILGNLYPLLGNKKAHLVFYDWYKKYGDIYSVRMGAYPTVILCSYANIKEAFVNKADIFSDRHQNAYTTNLLFKNKGIVWDSHWREIRRFTLTALKDFGLGKKTLEERVQEEISYLCEQINSVEGQPVKIQPYLTKGFANVICSVIFGKRFDYEDPSFVKILSVIDEIFRKGGITSNMIDFIPLLQYLPGLGYLFRAMIARRDGLENYVYDAIDDHRMTYDPGNIRDFIDLYLQNEQQSQSRHYLSRFTIVRIVIELFVAGTDTSSTTMTWALLLMIVHPNVQTKCREEIKKVIGSRMPESKDRINLPYVDATLMEIQRFSNIAPLSISHLVGEDTEIGGYKLYKGTRAFACIYAAHHDPAVWPDHEKFRPDRWLNQYGQLDAKNLPFVPFSLGRRQCLGEQLARLEMFMFFTSLIQRYEFVRVDPNTPPSLEEKMGLTVFPADGTIRFHRI